MTSSLNISKYFSEGSDLISLSTSVAGINVYNTIDELPLVDIANGSQAYVKSNNRLYIWISTGWYSVALINNTPSFDSGGSPALTYEMDSASPTIIQLSATDPEGLPIQWSYVASDSAQYFADISNDSSVFTITPKSRDSVEEYDSFGGVFSVTFKASDGVNLAFALSEFTLTFITPWPDITTAVSDSSVKNYYPDPLDSVRGIYSSPDNQYYYLVGRLDNKVYQYQNLNNSVATSTLLSEYTRANTQDNSCLFFSADGTKMFIGERLNNSIYVYTLSTPWDVTSAGSEQSFSPTNITGELYGISFSTDGLNLYLLDDTGTNPIILQYSLTTPWDLSTISYSQSSGSLTQIASSGRNVRLDSSGTKVYIFDAQADVVRQYNLSTQWDITSLSYFDAFSITGTTNNPVSFHIYSDGTKLLIGTVVVSLNSDGYLYQYSLG